MARKILELNPSHPIIKKLLEKVKEAGSAEPDPKIVELSDVLFDSAILNSGFSVEDTHAYFEKIEKIVRKSFEVKDDEKVEEPYVDLTEEGKTVYINNIQRKKKNQRKKSLKKKKRKKKFVPLKSKTSFSLLKSRIL